MKFKYKVQNINGQISDGTKDSADMFTLARELREMDYIPISIEEYREKKGFSFNFNIFGSGVSLSQKIIFTNNLSGMLSAGLPLTRALLILEKQSSSKIFNDIMYSLVEDINKGNTLSDGMNKYPKVFSTIFVSMVRSGEESGSLPSSLSEIGLNLKKTYDLNRKIKGALTYPAVILSAMILIGILMMIYVVPTLTQTFKDTGAELPKSTQFIIWVSDTLSQHTLFFLISCISLGAIIVLLFRLKIVRRYFDLFLLHIPIIGKIVKETNTARTARTLSSLLSSGVSLSKALSITEEVLQNFYFKKIINESIVSIEKGVTLSTSFKNNTKLYPVMMGEMVEVGEETGNLSKMLLDIANFYENEVDDKTKNLSTIIEPALMVVIGGAVGFFAVSMIQPMYSVMDTIN